jgi:L-iditol 2-dehydrogenase
MRALVYRMQIPLILLQKLHLARRYSLVQYRSDWDLPLLTQSNQVLLKTRMAGICGTDMHQSHTNMSYFASIWSGEHKISPLGHEVVAEVIKVGGSVNDLPIGTRVILNPVARCECLEKILCPACELGNWGQCISIVKTQSQPGLGLTGGGYSEFFLAYQKQLYSVPSDLPDEIAVLTEPFAVAITAVFRNHPQNSDTVIVIGAGIIGLLIVAAIRAFESTAHIIVFARYPFQADKAKLLGANEIILTQDRKTILAQIAQKTGATLVVPFLSPDTIFGGTGPDVIYDSIASEHSMDVDLRLVKSNGRIIIVGLGYSVTKKVDWAIPIYKETTLISSMMHGLCSYQGKIVDPFQFALNYMNTHQDLFHGLVTHFFSIDAFNQAFQAHEHKRSSQAIKIAFDWRPLE